MSFFDKIEQLNKQQFCDHSLSFVPSKTKTRGCSEPAPKCQVVDPSKATTENDNQDIWTPSHEEIERRRQILNRKPERLAFLNPCPICKGRAFIHVEGGGFVCRVCTPGRSGYPVEATGPDRIPVLDDELLIAGDNNLTATAKQETSNDQNEQQHTYFAASWPWIKDNFPKLLAAGWTRAALLRRSKFRWPYGLWGVAWLPPWAKKGVEVSIGRKGEIIFTYQSGEQSITQTIHKEWH